MTTFDPAYCHTVFFWFKRPDSASDRELFENELKLFLHDSTYAKTCFIGTPPKAIRPVVDDSFTYSLVVTFESAEAQQKYQDEPPHLRFVEQCKDLWEKVIVYDSLPVE